MTPDLNHIYLGDCIETMKTWPDNFVDTIITDPPYGLDFMGKDWDGDVPGVHFWTEMLRVAKPGAMLLSFGGTRTWHHLAIAIEKAGWQIRDCLMWLYGSGFPKSLDISKAIDKAKGAERERGEMRHDAAKLNTVGQHTADGWHRPWKDDPAKIEEKLYESLPATELSRQWSGYGTALKPAWEPIIVAMKPIDGTFAHNAETWGVAGINIDGSRIGTEELAAPVGGQNSIFVPAIPKGTNPHIGRWPANLILDEEAAGMLDGMSGDRRSSGGGGNRSDGKSIFGLGADGGRSEQYYDSGGASRFFYVAKSCRAERNEGCEGMENRAVPMYGAGIGEGHTPDAPVVEKNHHPTVKPLELMKYLCQLTRTPTGGIVLDPFAGSGTTLWAAEFHNRPWIGIEMNPEYVAIANARIARERSQMKMAI